METNIIIPDSTTDIPTIHTIYQDWQAGDCTAQKALSILCRFIANVQDTIDPMEVVLKQARVYASELVDYLGGSAEVTGFGELKITNPSVSYSYDKKLVDKLTNQLRTEGMGDVAARLDACLKPSEKAGSLRITRVKKDKEAVE